MTTRPRRKQPFLPTWGCWLIGGVLAVLALGLLALSGRLDETYTLVNLLGLLAGGTALYFIPSIIAKPSPRFAAILVANLFFGWTIIGWVIVLVWALGEAGSVKKVES